MLTTTTTTMVCSTCCRSFYVLSHVGEKKKKMLLRESRWRNKVRSFFYYINVTIREWSLYFCCRCVPLALCLFLPLELNLKIGWVEIFFFVGAVVNLFFSSSSFPGSLFDISILFRYIFDFEVCNAVWQVFILFLDLYWI